LNVGQCGAAGVAGISYGFKATLCSRPFVLERLLQPDDRASHVTGVA
jgi:hypothetical protein